MNIEQKIKVLLVFAGCILLSACAESTRNAESSSSNRASTKAESYGPKDLVEAAAAGDVVTMAKALKQGVLIDSVDGPGWTALVAASANGQDLAVRRLLLDRADVDWATPDGATPLLVGAMGGHQSVVERLLHAGADPYRQTETGPRAIEVASEAGHPSIVKLLQAAEVEADLGFNPEEQALVKEALRMLGHYELDSDKSEFDAAVRRSIKAFQEASNLEPSGYLNEAMVSTLIEAATAEAKPVDVDLAASGSDIEKEVARIRSQLPDALKPDPKVLATAIEAMLPYVDQIFGPPEISDAYEEHLGRRYGVSLTCIGKFVCVEARTVETPDKNRIYTVQTVKSLFGFADLSWRYTCSGTGICDSRPKSYVVPSLKIYHFDPSPNGRGVSLSYTNEDAWIRPIKHYARGHKDRFRLSSESAEDEGVSASYSSSEKSNWGDVDIFADRYQCNTSKCATWRLSRQFRWAMPRRQS